MTSSPLVQRQNHLHNQYHPYHSVSFDQCDNTANLNNKNKQRNDLNFNSNLAKTTSSTASSNLFEIKEQQSAATSSSASLTKLTFNRINGGTPKRRSSYTSSSSAYNSPAFATASNMVFGKLGGENHIGGSTNQSEQLKSAPSITSINSEASVNSNESPFIKRKNLTNKKTRFERYSNSNVNVNNSPYFISSANLANADYFSPKQMNDSFESLNNNNEPAGRRRRSNNFFRYRSAPLTNSNICQDSSPQYCNGNNNTINLNDSKTTITSSQEQSSKALNDISNQANKQTKVTFILDEMEMMNADAKMDEMTEEDVNNDLAVVWQSEQQQMTIDQVDENFHHHQQMIIKQSVELGAKCKNLIGDRSCEHILPTTVSNKHQDLNCITPETLVDVLNGCYDDKISECIIIDSRYPYEYEGGHISTALNIFTQEKLNEEMFVKRQHVNMNSMSSTRSILAKSLQLSHSDEFNNNSLSSNKFANLRNPNSETKRKIVIFHCEFSSERGPSLLRFLRKLDRNINENSYPSLHYPELYLLEGGYKSFYGRFKLYCWPQNYTPMLQEEYLEALKYFRAKSKSLEVPINRSSYHQLLSKCTEQSLTKCTNSNYDNNKENDRPSSQQPHRIIKLKLNVASGNNNTNAN